MNVPLFACPRTLLALVFCGAVGLVPYAFSQTGASRGQQSADDELVELSPFTVDAAQDFGYRKTNAVTATRLGTPVIDTPLNIGIIGEDFLRDLAVDNIEHAFRYTPGVVADQGNDFRPVLRVRGFAPQNLYRDGFLRYYNFDLDAVEQIEVVKGPNAVFFGRTSPGGVINYVTKRPQFRNAARVEAIVGDHAYYKGLVDVQTTTREQTLAARVVASRLDVQSWLDEKNQRKSFVLANAIVRPTAAFEIYAGVEHTDNKYRGTGAYGLVYNEEYAAAQANGASPPGENLNAWRRRVFQETGRLPAEFDAPWFPRSYSFNKNGHGSYEEGRDTAIDFQVRLKPSEDIQVRFAYNHLASEAEQGFFINGSPDQTPVGPITLSRPGDDPATPGGSVLPANPSTTSLNYGFLLAPWFMIFDRPQAPYLSGGNQYNRNGRDSYQADLTFSFDAWGGRHRIVASAEATSDRYRQLFPLVDIAALEASGIIPGWSTGFGNEVTPYRQWIEPSTVGFGPPSFGWLPLDVTTLTYDQIPDLKTLTAGYSDELGDASYFAGTRRHDRAIGASYLGRFFNERVIPMGGVRHTETRFVAYDENGDRAPASTTRATTPMAGATVRVAQGLVAFGSYNRSFQVPFGYEGASNPVVTLPDGSDPVGGEPLPYETGRGFDLGLKTDFDDHRFSGTVSCFRVDRDGVLVRDVRREEALRAAGYDLSGAGEFLRATGLQRVEGIEGDLVYTPGPGYQAVVSVGWNFTREIVNPDPATINVARGGAYDSGIPGDESDELHRELAGVPEWSAAFLQKWIVHRTPRAHLEVGTGVHYHGRALPAQERRFGFRNPGYVLVDAFARYSTEIAGRTVELALTVSNILDEHYASGRAGKGAPRTWQFRASWRH